MAKDGHELVRFEAQAPGMQTRCPRCGMRIPAVGECNISWSEEKKQYQVFFAVNGLWPVVPDR
jgi:hypothetical protein